MSDTNSGTQSAQPNRRRLRSHLVNMDVRLRLVVDDLAFALIAALAAIGILYFMSNRELGDSMYSAHLSIKETRELLTSGVKIAGLVTFLAVAVFGLWSVVDAHRIAGPMHRLQRLLTEVAGGDLTHEIKFRKRDEFQEVANAADSVVDAYAAKIGQLRRQLLEVSADIGGDSLTPVQLRQLRERMAAIEGGLAFFRLPKGQTPEIDNTPIG